MKYHLKVIYGKEQVDKTIFRISLTEEEEALNVKYYEFKTETEKNAFIRGLEAAVGWNEVYILPISQLLTIS